MKIFIPKEGTTVRLLYQEELPLHGLGRLISRHRVSDVEPMCSDQSKWGVYLRGERKLLSNFPTRSLALQAERDYLEENGL